MTRYTLSILEEHRSALERSLLRDENEYAALLICGRARTVDPWTGEVEERFLVRELIEVDPAEFTERTPYGLTWSTTPFYRALKQTEPKDFALAVVHSHPNGPLKFSVHDDEAEAELFRLAFAYLDSDRPHLSIIMDGAGKLVARAYGSDVKPHPVELIRVIGPRWIYEWSEGALPAVGPEFDRQVRAFGKASTRDLAALRVGIAGCGGMGSAVLSLVTRMGVQKVVLFDDDRLEDTNLNRVHFSRRTQATLGALKVDVLAEGAADIGLPMSIVRRPVSVTDTSAREALLACDIIFGCTDDHLGRNFLNRLAHFYLVPIIDMGLLIEPNEAGGYDVFDGRVTVVQPGYVCQVCRGLIQPARMLAEGMRRNDPERYEFERRAGYVPGAPDPSPVVVTFSSEVAAMAVNELMQRLTGYRGLNGECSERVRRFDEVKDADTVPGGKSLPTCKLCSGRYNGRGDMTPFLDMPS